MRKSAKTIRHTLIPRWFGIQPKVDVYLSLADPHCYMLIQALIRLQPRYKVEFRFYLVTDSLPGTSVAPELQRRWAIKDANLLAALYDFEPVEALPEPSAIISGQQLWQLTDRSMTSIFELFKQTWADSFNARYLPSTPVINHLIKNQQRLIKMGHYQSGSMFFDGQWYVGVDRLCLLEEELAKMRLNIGEHECLFDKNVLTFPPLDYANLTPKHPIEIYISLRSPYSYIGFLKAVKLSEYYHAELIIKPVLPLMMKGLYIPHNKQKYIYIDAHREATKAKIPFSNYSDPIGQGIVNCYHVYGYAKAQNKAKQFIEAVFKAIYVDGVDVADEDNIARICQLMDIDYQAATLFGVTDDWQVWADANFAEMENRGFWGVPCIKYGEDVYWGQDRLPFIEQTILSELN